MPYNVRKYQRFRRPTKKRYVARKAYRKRNYRKPWVPRPELKNHENLLSGQVVLNSGLLYNLTQFTQGVETDQILGRKIMIKQLHLKGSLFCSNAGTTFRYAIVRSKDNVNPTFQDVWDTDATGNYVDGFRNLDNIRRFEVLYDKRIAVTNQNFYTGAGTAVSRLITVHLKMNKVFQISDADVMKYGGIYLMICSNNVAGVDNFYEHNCRIRYTDN